MKEVKSQELAGLIVSLNRFRDDINDFYLLSNLPLCSRKVIIESIGTIVETLRADLRYLLDYEEAINKKIKED